MSVTELLSFESTRLFVPHTDLDGNSVRVRTLSSPIRHLSSRRLDWPVSTESMLGVTNLLDPWRDRCLHILVAGAAASVAVLLLPLPT